MAGFLLPLLFDAMGGGFSGEGYTGYQEMAHMTSTAQDSSADSNVWNTQGPSANHGSINFNFHVNNENFTSPMGSNEGESRDPEHLEQLLKQNNFLKNLLSKFAPGIGPMNARRKRSVEETSSTSKPVWRKRLVPRGGHPERRGVVCARPSPRCRPKDWKRFTTTTTTARPIYPLPLLGGGRKPSDCVLDYFSKILRDFRGVPPRNNNKVLGLNKVLGK